MSFIDLFKSFHSRAIAEVYPASARVLFDSFLYDFNAAYWSPELIYSERELSRLTGLSQSTIHRAIKFLSDRGIIKTWRTRNKTVVKLLGDAVPQPQPRITNESNANQTRINSESKSLVSYTRTRVIKTEDVKTDDDACARTTDDVAEVTDTSTDAYTQAIPLSSPEAEPESGADAEADANDIQAEWVKEFGYDLRGNRALELEQLAAKDYERAQKAITRTKSQSAKSWLNDEFAYFKVVYDGLKPTAEAKPTPLAKDSTAEQLRKLDELMAKFTEK